MILDEILEEKKHAVSTARFRLPLADLEKRAASAPPVRSLAHALRTANGMACIAEFKRRSPSKGWIRKDADPVVITKSYEAAGAAALSVLTDTPFFGGTLDDLRKVRENVAIPILRKDFVIDPYQVVEARAAGADAVLLIVSALDDSRLGELFAEVEHFGMEALVETHNAEEVDRALSIGARIIGVNHRDLRTFEMNMDLAVSLRPRIPPDRIVVAESGLHWFGDVARMGHGGINAILVGESLMRAEDPGAALRKLLGDD